MPEFKDLSGKQINYWTVISRANHEGIDTRWNCKCLCGIERIVRGSHLASGASKSCGCRPSVIKTHGETRNKNNGKFRKKYRTWRSIRARCLDINNKDANIYYGLLCDEWKDFNNFNRDVPDPIDNSLTIDRIENSKGYEPGNVRWVTFAEQHRNQSNCVWIEYDGRKQLLTDWAKEIGIHSSALSVRIRKYGVGLALATPSNKFIAPSPSRKLLTKDGITDYMGGWMKRLKISWHTLTKMINDGKFN